jgi:hypothetical protein
MTNPGLDWSHDARLVIGQTLLTATERTLTAPEIALATGRTNVKRTADEMVDAGLLENRPPPPATKRPGRPPTAAYFLPDACAKDLEEELARRHPVGRLQKGQHIVFAEAGATQIAGLFEALEVSSALARASWFALLDGEPQEMAIVFAGSGAVEGAVDLMAELRGAELRARRSALTNAGSIERLAARTRRAASASRHARHGRSTRGASAP